MSPLVSIIVPIYNAGDFLIHCLDSVVQQTYLNLEIILINDGSTDDSLKICNRYAQEDNRIVLIDKENEGVSIARNTGIQNARGDYFAFLDADDWIAPNYIEQLMSPFENENVDISICGYRICQEYTPPSPELSAAYECKDAREYLSESQKFGNFATIVPWGKIIKKKVTKGVLFPPKKYFEDEATVYKFFYASNQIAESGNKAYYYLQSSNGLTKVVYPKHPEDAVVVFEEKYQFFKERNDKRFLQYALATLLWKCLTLYTVKKDKRKYAKNKIAQYVKAFDQYNVNYEHSVSLKFFCRFPFIYLLYKKFF